MIQRFAAVFDRYQYGRYTWRACVLRTFRTRGRAVAFAERWGCARLELQVTHATYHGRRDGLSVVDRKTGKTLWEHDGVVVPSVGEVGYW